MMCKLLEVSRSGFYEYRYRLSEPDPRQAFLESCKPAIKAVFTASKGTYGTRRMRKALFREHQILLSRRSVAAAMAELGLRAKSRRIRTKTTISSASNRYYAPDLLQRNFSAPSPGAVFAGDITYIRTTNGFIYLATVIDCFSKAVVGWAIDDNMKTSLIIKAVEMAQRRVPIIPGKTTFHSDRGSQYSSGAFREVLSKLGIVQSQGKTGSAFDNAMAESFFSHLKTEGIYPHPLESESITRIRVADYIESFYNSKRLHSGLGYMAPFEFLEKYYENQRKEVA